LNAVCLIVTFNTDHSSEVSEVVGYVLKEAKLIHAFLKFRHFLEDFAAWRLGLTHRLSTFWVGLFGGVCHRLLAFQRANPSSRRKEKASKTERSLLAHLVCLQPQISLQTHRKT